MTKEPELPEAVKQFLHDTMRQEYEIGVTDGMSICTRGLERAAEDPSVAASSLKPGFDMAISIMNDLLAERPQVTKDKGVHGLYAKN